MAARIISPFAAMLRWRRWLSGPLVVATIALAAIGFFGTAYLLGGRRPPRTSEVPVFLAAFTLAGGLAAVIALLCGGRRRWAVDAALATAVPIVPSVGVAWLLLWLAPPLGRQVLGLSKPAFLASRRRWIESAGEVAGLAVPTAMVMGLLVGAIAGTLLFLHRCRPRLIAWLEVSLLLACVVGSTHVDAFGRMTEFVVEFRLRDSGRMAYTWLLAGQLASAISAGAGAVVGAVISCGAVQMAGAPRRGLAGRRAPPACGIDRRDAAIHENGDSSR